LASPGHTVVSVQDLEHIGDDIDLALVRRLGDVPGDLAVFLTGRFELDHGSHPFDGSGPGTARTHAARAARDPGSGTDYAPAGFSAGAATLIATLIVWTGTQCSRTIRTE